MRLLVLAGRECPNLHIADEFCGCSRLMQSHAFLCYLNFHTLENTQNENGC